VKSREEDMAMKVGRQLRTAVHGITTDKVASLSACTAFNPVTLYDHLSRRLLDEL
jgi:hypothetical protein